MNKKDANILAIMSSPRANSNTDILLQHVCKGINDVGGKVDVVMLRDNKIAPCTECYGCKKDGHCVIKDDFQELYRKLETCRKLIIAMPVFFSGPPAQLKAVIDRCQAFFVRKFSLKKGIIPKNEPKREMYLVAVGGCNDKSIFEGKKLILKYFLQCLDIELTEGLLINGIDKKGDILKHQDLLDKAYELGRKIANK